MLQSRNPLGTKGANVVVGGTYIREKRWRERESEWDRKTGFVSQKCIFKYTSNRVFFAANFLFSSLPQYANGIFVGAFSICSSSMHTVAIYNEIYKIYSLYSELVHFSVAEAYVRCPGYCIRCMYFGC